MNYYGIVGKHGFDYGIYSRSMYALYECVADQYNYLKSIEFAPNIIPKEPILKELQLVISWALNKVTNNPLTNWYTHSFIKDKLCLHKDFKDYPDCKFIIIPNILLGNDYSIKNDPVLFSLFKNSNQFKTIMKKDGGNSNLIIIERDHLPNSIKHWGGTEGIFDYGLYCEHPKNKNILLPLNNLSQKVKEAILEETIQIYQNLGAENILIEDIKDVTVENNTDVYNKVNVKADVSVGKEVLRAKKYVQGTFNPDLAFKDIYFARDYDSIMNVAQARINGNQIVEEFTETINVNVGVDVDILNLFDNDTNFKYKRKWHFKVEFFDKNKL